MLPVDNKVLAMKRGSSTIAIHGDHDPLYRSATFPIYQTSTFGVAKTADYARFFVDGDLEQYVYTRAANPTIRNVEKRIAALEHTDDGVLFASGMAAITSAVLAFAKAGDAVACSRPLYGGATHFLEGVAPQLGLRTAFLADEALYALDQHVPDARVVYLETPANPTIKVIDIARVVAAARRVGAITIIDNTFASPINQTPIDLGVDVVLHSTTKYLGGHSDLIGGAVVTREELIAPVREMMSVFGGCASPIEAFLLDRSLKTLKLRVDAANANAMQIAQMLADDPRVETVYYPGLPGTEDHEIARRQMHGFGGMLALEFRSDNAAATFADNLKLALNAVSLGGVETLVTVPALSTHAHVPEEENRIARVTPRTVRMSAGLEDIDDLLDDIRQALSHI
jgi:cystathionine beta-lyase/cystathionine gamma-synthase